MIPRGDVLNSASLRKREAASVVPPGLGSTAYPFISAEGAAPPKIKDYTVMSGAAMKRFCAAA
jgi:hypothetical protein